MAFISVERFQSLTDPGKLLSLSFWRDEDAVRNAGGTEVHRQSQAAGRAGVFADYRLRIASVVRDYGMAERGQAPRIRAPFTRRSRVRFRPAPPRGMAGDGRIGIALAKLGKTSRASILMP